MNRRILDAARVTRETVAAASLPCCGCVRYRGVGGSKDADPSLRPCPEIPLPTGTPQMIRFLLPGLVLLVLGACGADGPPIRPTKPEPPQGNITVSGEGRFGVTASNG